MHYLIDSFAAKCCGCIMDMLVSAEWLNEHRNDPEVKIIEAPWKPEGYARAHIEGALLLPWHPYLKTKDESGERSPHLIAPEDYSEIVNELGVKRKERLIVYDEYHGLFATRFWWVFQCYGFTNVSVLNGGWQDWLEKGYPISAKPETVEPGSDIEISLSKQRIIEIEELKIRLEGSDLQIWDARRNAEYVGTEETSNRRVGHIPGAINLNWTDLLEEPAFEGGSRKIKEIDELRRLFDQAGFQMDRTIACHCQASVRGAFVSFVLEMLGHRDHRVYDAAMAEWANLDDTPLET